MSRCACSTPTRGPRRRPATGPRRPCAPPTGPWAAAPCPTRWPPGAPPTSCSTASWGCPGRRAGSATPPAPTGPTSTPPWPGWRSTSWARPPSCSPTPACPRRPDEPGPGGGGQGRPAGAGPDRRLGAGRPDPRLARVLLALPGPPGRGHGRAARAARPLPGRRRAGGGGTVGGELADLIRASLEFYWRYLVRRGVGTGEMPGLLAPYLAAAERA